MIVPERAHVGRMIRYVGLPVLLLVIWDVLIVVAYKVLHWEWVASTHVPLALYGSAIGIIVGFRNNSAYGRWWEARTLWGQIVNESRSLARQVCTTPRAQAADEAQLSTMQSRLVHHQIAYIHALRQQLRKLDQFEAIQSILSVEELDSLRGQTNIPVAIQLSMGTMLRDMREHGWIDSLEWQAMDRNLDDLLNAQGGNERIKNTPMPKQYDFFPMLFVQIYCLLLPIGMVENLGWFHASGLDPGRLHVPGTG